MLHKAFTKFGQLAWRNPSLALKYGASVASVIFVLTIALALEVRAVAAPVSLFICALMFSTWYGGLKPGLLTMLILVLAFKYYFISDVHSWTVEFREWPRLLIFTLASIFVLSLGVVQKRTSDSLKSSNESLKMENAERKSAERALKRMEDHHRLMLDTIPIMAWTILPDGKLDFLNQRWLDYTGLTLHDSVNNSLSIVHPDDLQQALEKWAKTMASGESADFEMRLRRADGVYRWFLVRTVPVFDTHGKIVKWYGTSTDIEDRRRAESQLEVLIDAIPQQIWSGPPDGTLDFCNQQWRTYMGLELDQLRGRGWQAMLHPEDCDRVLKAWHVSVSNGTAYQQEERHRAADGSYRWFLSLGVPLRDSEGRIMRWYGTNTDIQDQKQAEQLLRQTQEALARVARATTVGELTASIAHEVNQPLAAVVINADACLQWLDSETPNIHEVREALQRIVRDGNRASNVIKRIRTLLENYKSAKTRFLINDMVREIVAITEAEALRRQVTVQFLEHDTLQMTADRVQIQQVLMNLVMNAFDSLNEVPKSDRRVIISVRAENSNTIEITVDDSGIGIAPEQIQRVFEPFHTTKVGGLGLGLWISRSIVESHGGRLQVHCNHGPGVRFAFTLPIDGGNQ
ncbi:MAG: sensor histidine kinase [Verrucomicrobiales bacterium]|nr:sensor histidine kinase [Verrucomicrobiales bacterium]